MAVGFVCRAQEKKHLKIILFPAQEYFSARRCSHAARLESTVLGVRSRATVSRFFGQKRVRAALWRPERPEKSPSCDWSEADSWGSGHRPNHWQFGSDGKQGPLERAVSSKKYSSVYLPPNDKRLHLNREVSELQMCQQRCGGLVQRQQEGKPERTR